MKKIILASLLALTASAAMAVDGTACSAGTATNLDGSTALYIRSGFKPVCSANSVVVYTDSAPEQKLYAGAASAKGSGYFGGSTLGGAVSRIADCANKSCGGTEATTKAEAGRTTAAGYGASS